MNARERILRAAVRAIAHEGIDGVRIARIAVDSGVSPSLVHYHFADRDALLAEALDFSYAHAGERRLAGERDFPSHAARLQAMVEQCLPTTELLHEDWFLWIELWLRAARHSELRPFAEELYARLRGWFAAEIAAGTAAGEFARCDPDDVADRTLALLDGYGVRVMMGDGAMPLERAVRSVSAALAQELGLGETLVRSSTARAAPRPVRTAPSM